MARNRSGSAFKLAILTLALGACTALADPPAKLPLLPPPGKAPEKAPAAKPAQLPAPLPAPKAAEKVPQLPAPKAAEAVPVTRVPVEVRIAIPDLEKEMLRSMIRKIDPNAEVKLPFTVKGNEKDFALGAAPKQPDEVKQAGGKVEAGKPDAVKQAGGKLEAPRAVEVLPPPAPDVRDVRPGRPRLLGPRPPGTPGLLGRLASRPLVNGVIGLVTGNVDLNYRIEIRSFKMAMADNVLTCEIGGGFHCEGKAPPALPGQPPFPAPNVRDISVKLTVVKELVWGDGGKLELKDGASRVWIDPTSPPVGIPLLDIERAIRLNGILGLLSGTVDRQVMKQLSAQSLPDLATIAPRLKEKMPFFAVSEITAYPIRGNEKEMLVSLVIGLVPSNKKSDDSVKVESKPGPAPKPKFKGQLVFDKDGKPDLKLDPLE